MQAESTSTGPSATPSEVRRQVQRILKSDEFADTERLRTLFSWLVEEYLGGRAGEIKESLIGVEVFRRDPAWDPQTDALVRVQVRNLRLRLSRYYEGEGSADDVVITIPRGQYVPRCTRRGPLPTADPPPARRPRRWLAVVGLAAFAGVVLWMVVAWWHPNPAPAIGVAPILNLSGDAGNDYVALGLTEELTSLLARSPAMRVASLPPPPASASERNTALRLKARQAGVEYVLAGSIRRAEGREDQAWLVTARLLDVRSGFYLWSERRNVSQAELEGVPESVAQGVRRALSMSGAEAMRRETDPELAPAVVEAHELYLRGLYARSKTAAGSVDEARRFFERAVALDPHHSRAHAALGDAYLSLAFHSGRNDRAHLDAARREADQARKLAPDLPEATALRGRIAMIGDWDPVTAERLLRQALEQAPGAARTHQSYAIFLMSRRRDREALDQVRAARDLDPISMSHANDYGVVLYAARRYPEALKESERLLELRPEAAAARFLHGLVLGVMQRYTEALPEFDAAEKGLPECPELIGHHGAVLARAGRTAEARALLARLGGGPRIYRAMVLASLGEQARAVEELRLACDAREPDLLFLDAEPLFEELRGNAEFERVRGRVGLAPRS